MAATEGRRTRPGGLVFQPRARLLSAEDVGRALRRMAHEIVERNSGIDAVVLVGLQRGGVPFADALAANLAAIEGASVPVGALDVAFYRDDVGSRPVLPESASSIPVDLTGATVVLVDDVLFTGRTIRAALHALSEFGRPGRIQLAVLVDRGHRELPIRPDFVGKNLPTSLDESLLATLEGVELGDDGARVTSDSLLGQDLVSVAQLSGTGIVEVLEVAEAFAEVSRRSVPKVPTLRGRQVTSLFFEESTRTRLSFETAARRLSADVASLAVASSSVKKGESLRDTIETVEALGADVVVVRHPSSGAPAQVARWLRHARVVNAGDGFHEHPSQALIDVYSVREALCAQRGVRSEGSGAAVFDGLSVLIVGDVRHSRVARSEVLAYGALGARVTLCAPGTLLPRDAAGWGVEVAECLDDALAGADVVSLLRLQTERGSGSHVPTLAEYTATHGLTERRCERLKPGAVITHPGPMTRGVEIASAVADAANVLVTAQVQNGVAVRMAILFLVLGGEPSLVAAAP